MSRLPPPANDYYQELISVGPFGGVDPTTSPYYVAPTNFVDMRNLLPNQQYGGYITVPGRVEALAALLPSPPTGMGQIQRAGQPTIYLFACGDGIYQGVLGGTPTALSLPEALTPGNLTYFVSSRAWVFVTNGVDTPIKIAFDDLTVTFWGIVAPTVAPTAVISGVGPLVGTYYYCETFSTDGDVQESGQGAISASITASGTPATGTITFGGTATSGDGIAAVIEDIPTAILVQTGQTVAQAVAVLAGQINLTPSLSALVVASTSGTDLIITTVGDGTSQNTLTYYGAVTTGATETVTPTTPTLFTGGTTGNSITITPTATTTDPQVTTRNLYRIGGSLGTWYLIASQPVADMTPYLDVLADVDVVGQALVVFREPPYAWKAIALYQDRIFGFGYDGDLTLVGWSNYNEPWAFNYDTNVLEAGPNDFDDVAVTCGSIGSLLILNKTRSCYGVVGQSDTTFTVVPIAPVGCISARSLAIGEGSAMWEALRGTQLFNINMLAPVTISDTQYQQSNVKALRASFSIYDIQQSIGFYWDRLMCMSYPSQNLTTVYDLRSNQWYILSMALGCVLYDPESEYPVIGSNLETGGQIDEWFGSTTNGDLGNPITAYILSRVTDCGKMYGTKSANYAYIEAPVQDAVCNFYIFPNPGSDWSPTVTAINLNGSGTPRNRWELPVGLEFQELQIMLQTISLDQVTLQRAAVYGLIPRVHDPSSPTDG